MYINICHCFLNHCPNKFTCLIYFVIYATSYFEMLMRKLLLLYTSKKSTDQPALPVSSAPLSCHSRECSGSVVECLTRDRGAVSSSLIGVTAMWSLSKTHLTSLVLVQSRKTLPCLTERLLMGRKESNKQNHVIGPYKDSWFTENCIYFLTHQFKHLFWVLKRTISLRRFF